MWRNKKWLIIGLLVLIVLGGTLGGIAIAQANTTNSGTANTTALNTLMEKIATIYQQNTGVAIDPQQLAKAFSQAQQEMRDTALDNYLTSWFNPAKSLKTRLISSRPG
jgi:hypothetical protein